MTVTYSCTWKWSDNPGLNTIHINGCPAVHGCLPMSSTYTYKGDSTRTSSKTSTLDLGQDVLMSFFLSTKQNNNANSAWCSPEELFWRARKMSRASALGTVPRKTKRNETSQDKHNDNLLSERLKKKTNGFRNWQIWYIKLDRLCATAFKQLSFRERS